MNRTSIFLLLSILALIFVYGCAQTTNFSDAYVKELKGITAANPNGQVFAAVNSSAFQSCIAGKCTCMVCKNGTSFFPFYNSLVGGECHFEQNCDADKFNALTSGKYQNDPSLFPRQFMVGQGPTMSDFGDGNPYCSNRLGMAVQWLVGSNVTPYNLPNAGAAICSLDAGVMPLYVLYTNSTNINTTRSKEIAQYLQQNGKSYSGRTNDKVGPTIITTEIDYNSSNDTVVQLVADQVEAIYSGCGNSEKPDPLDPTDGSKTIKTRNCLVALAPMINDRKGLDKVMNKVGADGRKISDKVDLVAFGVNYRNMTSCDGDKLLLQASSFATYALYTWGKPTVIPYILFDSEGTDFTDDKHLPTCHWSEYYMQRAYSSFFGSAILVLPRNGVIGMAPYSFNSARFGFNPLNCKDCDLGKSIERIASWYGGCQKYTTISSQIGASVSTHPSAGTLLVFSNTSGGYCSFNDQYDFLIKGFTFASRDIAQQQAPGLEKDVKSLVRCDACLSESAKGSPFKLGDSSIGNPPNEKKYCTSYPEIDYWASRRGLDPSILRSVIYSESDFTPCSVAKVCSPAYLADNPNDKTCFPTSECYAKGYDSMVDPSGQCGPFPKADQYKGQPAYRYCAMGITQILEPPYTFWPEGPNAQILKDAQNRGLGPNIQRARDCSPKFNPFNVEDALCAGSAELADKFAAAKKEVADAHKKQQLNWYPTDNDYIEKENLMVAYVALMKYRGFWESSFTNKIFADRLDKKNLCRDFGYKTPADCYFQMYSNSWYYDSDFCANNPNDGHCANGKPKDGFCADIHDPIEFIDTCFANNDPAAKELANYYVLRDKCSTSSCPSWKKVYDLMQSSNLPNKPKLPKSGNTNVPDK
ncbi:hypothetical protein HY988_03955 [Candidatus Micrarchaeota archaeon]|nr:hypothetical protein [Candidatus Micrarchaeota archaeon]